MRFLKGELDFLFSGIEDLLDYFNYIQMAESRDKGPTGAYYTY